MTINRNNQAPEWDLTEFYSGIDDPQIEKDKQKLIETTDAFVEKYKGKINSQDLTPQFLLASIKDSEEMGKIGYKFYTFASLLRQKNTLDEEIGAFYQSLVEFSSQLSAKLVWYELEWLELDEKRAEEVLNSPELVDYKHSLTHERIFKPFALSEKEEVLLTKISPAGAGAFVRLFDQIVADSKFLLEIEGVEKELSISELSPYLSENENREIRLKAAKSLTKGLEKNKRFYTFILNDLLLAKKLEDEIRGYEYPQHPTFLGYEIEKETVDVLTDCVIKNYSISEKYYSLKSKLLGFSLTEVDRYSKIYSTGESTFSWEETKTIVLEAFNKFDGEFKEKAQEFFENNWIDAKITEGKSSGAFCMAGIPSEHPFILMNFNGKQNDILTLAHELGHGLHDIYASKQPQSEFHPSTTIAEIASTFCESIVFDSLYEQLEKKEEKVNLLADKIQGSFATVFRQIAFYLFESDINNHRRETGELKESDFNNYYQSNLQKMFGGGLTLSEDHKIWWMYISHFYHFDFYVFTYAFGELLSLALYGMYKEEGSNFIENYKKALSAGGSKSPYEITKMMGIDISDPNFWQHGFDILNGYVAEFENLVS